MGILGENDRVELIHGEIVEKMPIGNAHAACVKRLNQLLIRAVDDQAIVSVQDPIRLNDSRPEPDVALLQPRDDFYAHETPTAHDVLLLIEVADTSLEFDSTIKRELYGQSGIREYWVVDVIAKTVMVFRNPDGSGHYRSVDVVDGDLSLPVGASLRVADLFRGS